MALANLVTEFRASRYSDSVMPTTIADAIGNSKRQFTNCYRTATIESMTKAPNKVSKNDYTARQIALGKKCDQLASPEVTTENYIETLRFECKDGRSIEVTCKSEHCQ